MLTLNNLSSPKGAIRNTKRIGRGQGSGYGTQAGKGHKGQKARSGGGVRTGFEGGSMPLYMRLPKRGFKNAPFKKIYAIVSLDRVEDKITSDIVNREVLIEAGLLSGINKRLPIKILNGETFTKKLIFEGIDKFSATAQSKIAETGSTIK
jgi:large subunit ribosomal protein L15